MKIGKIESGIPVPQRLGADTNLYDTLKALQPGQSVYITFEAHERHKKVRWALNGIAARALGKGRYSTRVDAKGVRVWHRIPKGGPTSPQHKGRHVSTAFVKAKQKLLSLKPGHSAIFTLDELDERQISNMAYNGLGKGHFKTLKEGNFITVWRQ